MRPYFFTITVLIVLIGVTIFAESDTQAIRWYLGNILGCLGFIADRVGRKYYSKE
jgi:hypothetical protein